MSALLTGDIHLTDKPADEYRWNLWPSLREEAKKHSIDVLLILGDLTEAKDKHSSTLVNRFCDELLLTSRSFDRIVILKGNHDYIDENNPFFRFLRMIPNVIFIRRSFTLSLPITGESDLCLFLPATRNWQEDWDLQDLSLAKYVFCHATFEGALSESGYPLPGIPPSIFGDTSARIFSGDIHTPGSYEGSSITRVGAPYHIDFGDGYTPRLIRINNKGQETDIRFPFPNKHKVVVRNLKDLSNQTHVNSGDFVKIKVKLHRHEYDEWPSLRRAFLEGAAARGWRVGGIELESLVIRRRLEVQQSAGRARTPSDLVREYAASQRLEPELLDIGLSLIQRR